MASSNSHSDHLQFSTLYHCRQRTIQIEILYKENQRTLTAALNKESVVNVQHMSINQ